METNTSVKGFILQAPDDSRPTVQVVYFDPSISYQDKTWAEFSSFEEAVYMPFSYIILKQNCLT